MKNLLLTALLVSAGAAVFASEPAAPPAAPPAEQKPDPEMVAQIERGARLLGERKLEEAGEVFMKQLQLHPAAELPVLGLMKVGRLYMQQNETGKALEWLTRGIEAAERRGELRIAKASIHILAKDYSTAGKEISQAVKDDAKSERVLGAALTCLAEMDRFDEESYEIADRLRAIQKRPIDAYLFLALWHQNKGEMDKALDYALKATRLNVNNVQSRLVLGKLYEKMGKLDEAEREFLKMKTTWPEHFSGYMCLAEFYEKQGKKDLAREYADEAAKRKAQMEKQAGLEPSRGPAEKPPAEKPPEAPPADGKPEPKAQAVPDKKSP